ncbi:peptidoglycan D,D-transpeptidase FtsI family protein [Desulfurispira natronophila]|uniref:Cell division protein FtsI (Penicillin-binding protein 3) n=1 Tax=Desulfurispira natronophila TaxID=682562 RepID=A0A7W7Y4V3_9BACT|nr:penicillin-binding protein 2 [Desulfurispira natronophila]MBB5021969.1 cell division protein FtsI (penicillin-binding protein 3) [Desulfurispira natronophila]
MQTKHIQHFRFLQIALVLVGVLYIGYHLVEKQIIQHEHWKSRLAAQYDKDFTLRQNRAHIIDRHGIHLAVSTRAYSIYGIGSEIENHRDTASLIAQALGMPDYGPIYQRIAGATGFFWIARNVDPAVASQVADLRGVGLLEGERRFYPAGKLLAKVLGFTGVDVQGLEGIEHRFDRQLQGEEVRVAIHRDARRREIMLEPMSRNQETTKPPLQLSIDSRLQTFAHHTIKTYLEENNARNITIVAMNPHNGEILSMYSWPSFDPNNYSNYPRQAWRNEAVSSTFEPGSTIKLITYAAALQSNSVTLADIFYGEQGEYREGNRRIRDVSPLGWASVAESFRRSSNIITSKIAAEIPEETFYEYLRLFGMGQATGVELSGESQGLLRPPAQWSRLSRTSLAMGYEVSANALQMVRAYSAVANGGYLVRPTMIRDGNQDAEAKRILTPETASTMRQLLKGAVEQGTGRNAALEHFVISGKTGTAQKLDPEHGYSRDRHFASFIGFFPYDKPQVVMGVFVDEPDGGIYQGGAVAAPIFRDIAEKYISFYGLIPDKKGSGS